MTGSRVTLVLGGDWTGLYVNGWLAAENHSLSASDVLDALSIRYDVVPVDERWLEDNGSLPQRLDDVETGT